jgi:hypothetical protein
MKRRKKVKLLVKFVSSPPEHVCLYHDEKKNRYICSLQATLTCEMKKEREKKIRISLSVAF